MGFYERKKLDSNGMDNGYVTGMSELKGNSKFHRPISIEKGLVTLDGPNGELPVFMKTRKDTVLQRQDDRRIEVTKKDALRRYEDQLLKIEGMKRKEAVEFKQQLEHNAKYYMDIEKKKLINKLENKAVLERQIQDDVSNTTNLLEIT
jgi:hypothetical protein